MAVTRCVCHRRSFAEIRALAAANGWTTLEQVAAATGCGSGCGSCRPYLRQVLATGTVCFAVAAAGETPKRCQPEPWDQG